MITENSSHQRLFNGDHGLVLTDENNTPMVHFVADAATAVNSADDSTNTVKVISHNRLPQHETFYAMTVHKSQGSEYSTVVVVLPDTDSPILSRELLYTAITRARSRVVVLANEAQLRACIERRSVRQSGLREKFWTEPLPAQPAPVAGSADAKPPPATVQKSAKRDKPSKPVQQTLDF